MLLCSVTVRRRHFPRCGQTKALANTVSPRHTPRHHWRAFPTTFPGRLPRGFALRGGSHHHPPPPPVRRLPFVLFSPLSLADCRAFFACAVYAIHAFRTVRACLLARRYFPADARARRFDVGTSAFKMHFTQHTTHWRGSFQRVLRDDFSRLDFATVPHHHTAGLVNLACHVPLPFTPRRLNAVVGHGSPAQQWRPHFSRTVLLDG